METIFQLPHRTNLGRRRFMTCTAVAAGAAAAGAFATTSAQAKEKVPTPDGKTAPVHATEAQRKFMQEATDLATESVEKGWGGPFGAVIVKDGEIIGRGQNRVLLTGCPVFHAEVTAIMDASQRLNPKTLLGSDYGAGTILEMIPRPPNSPDRVPQRAKMLKGCEIYINGAPCPMCMSAIYWSRIDHVYFAASLDDTSHIGFDDAFQYEDFKLPWEKRRNIAVTPNFERDTGLKAYRAWEDKKDRHPY
ncbi:tRNA-specific adenosine deaminase [Methylocystis bryophila]|nr:tRNA-specific adenosine deaminase [Methylocystis bryophila]